MGFLFVLPDLHVVAIGGSHGGGPAGAGLGQLSSPHQLQQAEALPIRHPKLLTVLALRHTHLPVSQRRTATNAARDSAKSGKT